MSKFSNFKIKWPKSVEKLDNGGRLGPPKLAPPPPPPQKKKTIRWIRPCVVLQEERHHPRWL